MKETRTKLNQCPSCSSTIDAVTDAYGNATPTPGDLTVCFYCAAVLAFTDDFGLRMVLDDEFNALPSDDRNQLERVVRTIQAHGPGVR